MGGIPILDSGSECEDAHIRTAEAFMSGIKSAITASMQVNNYNFQDLVRMLFVSVIYF